MAAVSPAKELSPFESGYVRDESQLKSGLPMFEVTTTLVIFAFWTVS